jgi:two-component SAPR family response regulator
MAGRRPTTQRRPLLPSSKRSAETPRRCIRARADTYTLDRQQLRIDLDELDRLREQADGADEEHERVLLERALPLFRGEPLTGIDALWADGEQRRLTRSA